MGLSNTDVDYAYFYYYDNLDNLGWFNIENTYDKTVVCQKVKETQTSTVDRCNDENGLIKMTATLRNVAGSYGQANNGVITFDVDQLNSSFSAGF